MTSPTEPGPPKLAALLIRLSTLRDFRQSFLGDLEEEYRGKVSAKSKYQADNWYWQQAMASLPHLARTAAGQTQLLALAGATAAGYLMVSVFDIYIARNAAGAYASAHELNDYFIPRLIYFTLKLAGVALAGTLIATLTFRPDRSYWQNVRYRLAPLGLALALPATWLLVFQSDSYSPSYRLLWLAGIVPCLLIGAWLGTRLARHQK